MSSLLRRLANKLKLSFLIYWKNFKAEKNPDGSPKEESEGIFGSNFEFGIVDVEKEAEIDELTKTVNELTVDNEIKNRTIVIKEKYFQ